jgi:hypothetical protein
LLVGGTAELEVTRLDAMALRLRPARGFLESESQRAVRGAARPFQAGDEVALSDLRVRVGEVSADGRPLEADFSFAVPLEDPSLLWMRWEGSALAPYSPPAPGTSHVLPRIRTAAVLGGRRKR